MKTCNTCKELKPLEDFQKRATNKDGRTGKCKLCKRKYDNEHYASHPQRRVEIRESNSKRVKIIQDWIRDYLAINHCVDCGESDLIVLEFDHRGNKEFNVSSMMRGHSLENVKKEVAKCDVRCANCHRRKTAATLGSWRLAAFA